MDFNQNNTNGSNNNNGNWDRWNSNASNSSYYNQPTHTPYGQGFIMASAACGIMSLTTCCSFIFSFPLGALAILFALLAYRKGKRMHSTAKIGLISGTLGLISAIIMTISSLVMLPKMLEDETYRQQFDIIMEQMYGMDSTEFLEKYYGHTIED